MKKRGTENLEKREVGSVKKREVVRCFEPIIDDGSEMLILGSMPSVRSRSDNFYYSNPTNRFWKALSAVFKEDFVGVGSAEKRALLLKHRVALFDVFSCCEMKKERSSMDGDIRKQKFNDIPRLIKDSKINRIFITSKRAYLEFLRKFGKEMRERNLEIINLPSPSSANRSVFKTDEELIDRWKELIVRG